MSRKRDKPYSNNRHTSTAKRRRPHPPAPADEDEVVDLPISKPAPPPPLVVLGLSVGCSVLDLKSRFEIYGSISRIRIERDGVGCVAFRSKDSAEAAIAASLDPSFGITVQSQKVQVLWSTDPLARWREGVSLGLNKGANKESGSSPSSSFSSKLLRAEVPLSRHGRGNKLASAIVNPKNGDGGVSASSGSDVPFRGREIVAYDDIL